MGFDMGITVTSVMFRLSNGRSIELTMEEMKALREQFERIGIVARPEPPVKVTPCQPSKK